MKPGTLFATRCSIFVGCLSLSISLVSLSLGSMARAQEKSVKPGINDSFQDPNASQYVERFEREGREVYDQRDNIIKACEIKPGMVIADIGAGTGLFTRLLSKATGDEGKVYAVDIAENFIEHITEFAKQEGLTNVEGVICKPDFVNLPPNSVDLVYICDTYHHFEFPYKTMASIHRALKPNGRVVLVEFSREEGKSSEWIMGHVRAGQAVFTKEVTDSGFAQIKEVKGFFKESYMVHFNKAKSVESPNP